MLAETPSGGIHLLLANRVVYTRRLFKTEDTHICSINQSQKTTRNYARRQEASCVGKIYPAFVQQEVMKIVVTRTYYSNWRTEMKDDRKL